MKKLTKNKKISRVTINDVAKLAGVSKTTISRYLGKKYNMLAEDTRKCIEQAINTLGYRPNAMAMGLKINKSHIIGMVIADITNPFSTDMLRGAEDVCKKNDYSLIICNTDNNPVQEREYIFMLQAHRIDGLIINTTGLNNKFLRQLDEDEVPVVLVDRKIPELDFDTVSVDNKKATAEMMDFLINQQYAKIAFFTEPIKNISSRKERMETFINVLFEKKHISADNDVYEVDLHLKNNLESSMEKFLNESEGAKRVIFATNSVVMLKILSYIKQKNLRIPEDVGIVSFDNPLWTEIVGKGITTIEQPTYDIGVTAMNRILKQINEDQCNPEIIELPGKLIIRGSTLEKSC